MDKAQAIYEFWHSFGLEAYDENAVQDMQTPPPLPYITYHTATDALGYPVQLNASLWYHSTSWADISRKADEIASFVGYGGQIIPIEGGYAWLQMGHPFAQRMSDPDDMIRRIYLNIQIEFLTEV